ncbi:MAG: TadE/TadG family type IV pilus assembly protein [Desulfocucumaceae bacterium]
MAIKQKGSITLEATVVFPVFLAFMLLLISFIKIGLVYLAVSHAVGETAKQIATHSYPIALIKGGTENLSQKLGIPEAALFESEATKKLFEAAGEDASQQALNLMMKEMSASKIQDYLPGGTINKEKIEIEVKMCNPWAEGSTSILNGVKLNNEDIAIVARYKIDLIFPFFGKREVTLSSVAVERAWVR